MWSDNSPARPTGAYGIYADYSGIRAARLRRQVSILSIFSVGELRFYNLSAILQPKTPAVGVALNIRASSNMRLSPMRYALNFSAPAVGAPYGADGVCRPKGGRTFAKGEVPDVALSMPRKRGENSY